MKMKETTKKTLIKVLISFIKWLFGIGKEHIEKAENKNNTNN